MIAHPISCIILAGGESKRMHGEDKGLVDFNGQPLITHAIAKLKNQVDDIVISANRNFEIYRQFSSTVIPDIAEKNGPLSGISSSLPDCQHDLVLVVPCDMPYLPDNLVDKLSSNIGHSDIAIIEVQQRLQLVFLMRQSLLTSVRDHLSTGKYKLMQWAQSCSHSVVDFSDNAEAFKNMNTTRELDHN